MNNKKIVLTSVLDGFFQFFILQLLSGLVLSKYVADISFDVALVFSVIAGILATVTYFVFLFKERTNSTIILFSVGSCFTFILLEIILMIIKISFSGTWTHFPMREVGNADGILLIFTTVFLISTAFIIKLCMFVVFLLKNIYKSRKKVKK